MGTQGAVFVTILCGHAALSMAMVTIVEDPGKGLMRREKGLETQGLVDLTEEHTFEQANTPAVEVPELFCNDDFPLGVNNSNTCTNSTHHRLIFDEGMCFRAAGLAGAGVEHELFFITRDWQDVHPKGCFAWPCGTTHNRTGGEGEGAMCYYFNGNGNFPNHPRGEPVCFRADYLNGTTDTNGGCDEGYEVIMDRNSCEIAAECLGFDKEPEFLIGMYNFTKHNEYPKGCFIRKDTGAFQFNNISSLLGADPKNPQIGGGIPVCNVSSRVRWN